MLFPDERKHTFQRCSERCVITSRLVCSMAKPKVSHFDFFLFFISHPERAHLTPPASEKLLSDSVKTFTLKYTSQPFLFF